MRRAGLAARALGLAAWAWAPAVADEMPADTPPTGREIMERVDDREDGDRSIQDMQMILIDRGGGERVREIHTLRRDVVEDTQTIMFFRSPADVEDTAFLTYDYDGARDDDQWLYLPALKKTKRIASGDKSGSFMGSDFSYADMSDRDLEQYRYTLMGEAEVDGHPVWQVEAIPVTDEEIDQTGYTKSVWFVRKDNDMPVRAVHWVKKGSKLKYMEVTRLDRVDGIWTNLEIQMTTKKGRTTLHKTVLRFDNVRYNQPMDDDTFTVRRLEKGL